MLFGQFGANLKSTYQARSAGSVTTAVSLGVSYEPFLHTLPTFHFQVSYKHTRGWGRLYTAP